MCLKHAPLRQGVACPINRSSRRYALAWRASRISRHCSAMSGWLSSLERNLPVGRQTLISLTFEDTLRLVRSLFGAERETTGNGSEGQAEKDGRIEAWSRWLFAQTRGHPFFLIEHLKLAVERKG